MPSASLALLQRRAGFRALVLGEVVSMIGDWFSYVAVSVVVLATDSALIGVAMVLVAHTLPRVIAAPFAGAFADRMDTRTILISMSSLRGAFATAMLAALWAHAVWAMQLLLVGRMALGAFVDAATVAAMPTIVDRSELPLANTIRGVLWSVVFTLAVAAGGLATAAVGANFALLIDALTFFAAALLFRGVRALQALPVANATVAGDWREFMRRHPQALRITLSKLPVAIANGGAWVALHALTENWAHAAFGIGVLHACRAIGTSLGPLLWRRASMLDRHRGVSCSILAALLGTMVFVVSTAPLTLAFASILWGLGVGANWVCTTTRIQLAVPTSILGRISAIDIIAQTVGQCVGGLVCALLASSFPLEIAATASIGLALVSIATIEGLQMRRPQCAHACA